MNIENNTAVLDFETVIDAKGIKREYEEMNEVDEYCSDCIKLHYKHVKGTRCLSFIEKKILAKKFCVNKIKPTFTCDQCDKGGFPTINKMEKHKENVHNVLRTKKVLISIKDFVNPTFTCDECDRGGFNTINKMDKHKAKVHKIPKIKALHSINNGLKEYTKNKYCTKLAESSELKLNIPSTLRTYTRMKKPLPVIITIRKIKKEEEEPEFIVPD